MTKSYLCPKCSGDGVLPEFYHVEKGRCFRCDGTGMAMETEDRKPIAWLTSVLQGHVYRSTACDAGQIKGAIQDMLLTHKSVLVAFTAKHYLCTRADNDDGYVRSKLTYTHEWAAHLSG